MWFEEWHESHWRWHHCLNIGGGDTDYGGGDDDDVMMTA